MDKGNGAVGLCFGPWQHQPQVIQLNEVVRGHQRMGLGVLRTTTLRPVRLEPVAAYWFDDGVDGFREVSAKIVCELENLAIDSSALPHPDV